MIIFDKILLGSYASMDTHGDLGMDMLVENIFLALKMIIFKCKLIGKPVVKSPRPTHVEATNVANVVLNGTDCVMINGESVAKVDGHTIKPCCK